MLKSFLSDFQISKLFTKEELEFSLNLFKEGRIAKGEFLSKEGEVCNKLYIIKNGILRSFFYKDGEELTTYFNIEGTIATALRSYLKEVKAHENLQALTEVEYYYIKKTDMNILYNKIPNWNKIGRVLMEKLYVKMEERSISLQYNNAKERYLKFLIDFPDLANRIPLHFIASYIGVTPETLSRIRKKIIKED
jgi:CRP-like cAMP-binding protein